MTNREREIIKSALLAFDNGEVAAIDSIPEAGLTHTAEYEGKINEIKEEIKLRFSKKRSARIKKAWLIAAVLALTLLVTACTVGKPIVDFIKEKFDTHTEINIDDTQGSSTIERVYEVTYLPDGFSLLKQTNSGVFLTTWYGGEGNDEIILLQKPIKNVSTSLNTEYAELREATVGEFSVYYVHTDESCVCVWKNEEYSFTLNYLGSVSWDEMEKIIIGIK